MNKMIVFLFFFGFISIAVCSQDKIVYRFEKHVLDSLEKGIEHYSYDKKVPKDSLQLCVLIIDGYGEMDIFLQDRSEYRNFEALTKLINLSNRVMIMPDEKLLPIIFPSDIVSDLIIPERIQNLPFWGYYVTIDLNKGQKVIKTGVSF